MSISQEAPGPTVSEAAPTIADTSYRTYDGPLKPRLAGISRWGTVALATMRQNVNRKKFGYWIPAVLIFIFYLVFAVIFYLQSGFQRNMGAMAGVMGDPVNQYALTLYQAQSAIYIFLFAAAMTVGSASIAADNRANALLVYLSKPLGRSDYLLGKWLGVFGLLAGLSLIPALLLYLFFLTAYFSDGFLTDNPTLIFKVIAASLLPAALNASLMIGFSAWSKTPRLAGAIYAGFYFVMITASLTVGSILQRQEKASPQTIALVKSISVGGISDAVAQHLYDTSPQQVANQMVATARRRRDERRARRQKEEAARLKAKGIKPMPKSTPQPSENAGPDSNDNPFMSPERPPLVPALLIAGLFIALPLWAASARIKAVEIVKG